MLGPRRSEPVYCVLASKGAFYCPYSPVQGPLRTEANATLLASGTLKLRTSLAGTHAARPLPWQRYPHVDGYIHPWTASGRLRSGLHLKPWKDGHGGCFQGSEEVPDPAAISCLIKLGRASPCYPQKRPWAAGDIAACAGLADLTFSRFRITGR